MYKRNELIVKLDELIDWKNKQINHATEQEIEQTADIIVKSY